jgi:hypothetical protein
LYLPPSASVAKKSKACFAAKQKSKLTDLAKQKNVRDTFHMNHKLSAVGYLT